MESIKLDLKHIFDFIPKEHIYKQESAITAQLQTLYDKTGKGNDFLGWIDLPSTIDELQFKDIEEAVGAFINRIDVVVVVGIGGSYLGAKAVLEALSHTFGSLKGNENKPLVIFAGQNIGEDYMHD